MRATFPLRVAERAGPALKAREGEVVVKRAMATAIDRAQTGAIEAPEELTPHPRYTIEDA
jgi:hypothetical protein